MDRLTLKKLIFKEFQVKARKYGLKPSNSYDGFIDLLMSFFEENNYMEESLNPFMSSECRVSLFPEANDNHLICPSFHAGEEAHSVRPAFQNSEEALSAHPASSKTHLLQVIQQVQCKRILSLRFALFS